MFIMNATGIQFTNSETNPIQSWFRRMVNQLELNAYNAGLNWNNIEMNIVITLHVWNCVSRIYAYNSYYDANRLIDKNVYHTHYTDHVEKRHSEYLDCQALPIGGRFYSVVFSDEISDIHFATYVSGQFNKKLSGCIENVNCYFD